MTGVTFAPGCGPNHYVPHEFHNNETTVPEGNEHAAFVSMACQGCGLNLREQGVNGTEIAHNELEYEYIDGYWSMTYSRNMGLLHPPTYECRNCGRQLNAEQEGTIDA